jgi:hypothetical protein
MLAGAGQCPAPAGEHGDRWLVPAPDDYEFWLTWFDRRGRALEWINAGNPPGQPEVTFYMGTHRPSWLWDGQVDYPLCVSYSTLRKVRCLRRGRVRWICDSRAFSEITQYGRWTITAEEYLRFLARADQEIGGLDWAGPQDWPCEEGTIRGGMVGRVPAAGTGLTELGHQQRTVANFQVLTELWPQYSDRPCPVIPVLQGSSPDSYLRCYDLYQRAGVMLGEEHQLAGVGSVCRLQATRQLRAVARELGQLNLGLHWFGLKLTGLREPELMRDMFSPFICAGTQSCDSATWSETARREDIRLPSCTHVGRDGQPNVCNNCVAWATAHRATKVIPAIRAAVSSPRRDQPSLLAV